MEENQLYQHYAGVALNGILSSPRWSGALMDMATGSSMDKRLVAREVPDFLSAISWNIAEAMVREGKERGFVNN